MFVPYGEHYDVLVLRERMEKVLVSRRKDTNQDREHDDPLEHARELKQMRDIQTKWYNNIARQGRVSRRQSQKPPRGGKTEHQIASVNLGGSREALTSALEMKVSVLLLPEHRIAGTGLPRVQAMAMGRVWHGIWYATQANGNGRSGGTAVLVRRPAPIIRRGISTAPRSQ